MEGGSVGRAAMVWPVSVAGDTFIFYPMPQERNEVMVGSSSPPIRRRAPHCIEGSGDSRAPRAPLQMFVAGALHQREGAVNFVVEMAAAIPQH